jgi:predicted transposase YbfD/YdcC
MTAYLEQEWQWLGVQLSGRIRRSRRARRQEAWESQETWTWVSSLSPLGRTPERIAQELRGHWAVENGIFRVRDVTYAEDRLHGRKIGHSLAILRNTAITLIRREGYPYIPDGWRDIAVQKDHGFHLLTKD